MSKQSSANVEAPVETGNIAGSNPFIMPAASDDLGSLPSFTATDPDAVDREVLARQAGFAPALASVEDNSIQARLKDLFSRLTGLDNTVRESAASAREAHARLDVLTEQTTDYSFGLSQLEQRATDIETGFSRLAGRIDNQENETSELSERAVATSEDLQQLAGLTTRLASRQQRHGEHLDKLQGLTDALREDTDRHGAEISNERERLDLLEPKFTDLYTAHTVVAGQTEALIDANEQTGRRFQQAGWAALAITLIVGFVAGTAHMRLSETENLSIKPMLAQVSSLVDQLSTVEVQQQQDIVTLNEQLDGLNSRIEQPIAATLALQEQVQGVQQNVLSIDTRLDSELVAIKELLSTDNSTVGAPVDLDTLANAEWLRAQAPGNYVIQLGGVYGKRALSELAGTVTQSIDAADVSWFHTTYRGRDWYVLLYGNFASFDAALAALDALPEAVQSTRPYIRSVKGVQDKLI